MGNTLGMANQDDTRPVVSALSGGRRPVLGDWRSAPHLLELPVSHTAHHSRVASAYSPKGRYRALYAYQRHTGPWAVHGGGTHQSHADP